MKTADFNYALPPGLIAQKPVEPRDASRLMVLHRSSGTIEHCQFRDIGEYLNPGDVLVFNDTRVIPARLRGCRKTGGKVELLLLKKHSDCLWEALVRPGRVKTGEVVLLASNPKLHQVFGLDAFRFEAEIGETLGGGTRMVRLSSPTVVDELGEVPLPPYIHLPLADAERYQTVYSRVNGSAAAPTAGLHFTPGLQEELKAKGVCPVFVTLHIGLDTFRPVRDKDPRQHEIHTEYAEIDEESAEAINRVNTSGRKVVCVGTTSVRTVEGVAALNGGRLTSYAGNLDIFILPGYKFQVADAMVTNFHLPRTTLLMLTSAFAGREFMLEAYRQAIDKGYRFYSFGDAMLIL